MASLGLIGFGAIAQSLLDILREQPVIQFEQVSILVRSGDQGEILERAEELASGLAERVQSFDNLEDFLASRPQQVLECAGHGAVQAYGPSILRAGIDLVIASIGALSNQALWEELQTAARAGGSKLILPAGAIGGIDVLSAARLSGIESVVYTGSKPAKAWSGTSAAEVADLHTLTEPLTFFKGNAREAARSYPKNANVAATLAMAGIGFEKTEVHLVADPNATGNTHSYQVKSNMVDYAVTLTGQPSAQNPKTSMTTVYSLAREVLNRWSHVAI